MIQVQQCFAVFTKPWTKIKFSPTPTCSPLCFFCHYRWSFNPSIYKYLQKRKLHVLILIKYPFYTSRINTHLFWEGRIVPSSWGQEGRGTYDVCQTKESGGGVCVCGGGLEGGKGDAAQAPTQLCHISGRLGTHTCQARQRLLQRCTCQPSMHRPFVQTGKHILYTLLTRVQTI